MSVTDFDSLVHRVDDSRSSLSNPHGVPVTLFANRDVPIELEAVEQALGFVDAAGHDRGPSAAPSAPARSRRSGAMWSVASSASS